MYKIQMPDHRKACSGARRSDFHTGKKIQILGMSTHVLQEGEGEGDLLTKTPANSLSPSLGLVWEAEVSFSIVPI